MKHLYRKEGWKTTGIFHQYMQEFSMKIVLISSGWVLTGVLNWCGRAIAYCSAPWPSSFSTNAFSYSWSWNDNAALTFITRSYPHQQSIFGLCCINFSYMVGLVMIQAWALEVELRPQIWLGLRCCKNSNCRINFRVLIQFNFFQILSYEKSGNEFGNMEERSFLLNFAQFLVLVFVQTVLPLSQTLYFHCTAHCYCYLSKFVLKILLSLLRSKPSPSLSILPSLLFFVIPCPIIFLFPAFLPFFS